jgi:hypothetical protein
MSSTVSPEQEAGTGAAAQAGTARRRGGRRWVVAVAVVVVLAVGVVGAWLSGAFGQRASAGAAAASGYGTSTAPVRRESLTSQTSVNATLGDSGSYSVVNEAPGTLTDLPAVGRVVRQGQVLYGVDGSPVVLLYGKVPAYRALSEGMTGADVLELNNDLVSLGYASESALLAPGLGMDYYSSATAAAVEDMQTTLGITKPTGKLALGAAVFLPTALKITALSGGVVSGGSAAPGSVLMTATSTTPVVTIDLDADEQTEVKVGDPVGVTLPDGITTKGTVSSVSKVATTNSSGTTTVTVLVALRDPRVARRLEQAPVTVTITSGSVSNALVVPVDALLARSSGGYAVEVTGPHGRHLVSVTTGLFDDAAGLVQVTGSGLAVGQRVVVPSI